ncbi:hypothetical protein [Haloferula sp.]|uniref:hypothetical protein n=1 Tax=Haloferula sp. TaxID=2497595 RepID=UPI003C727763
MMKFLYDLKPNFVNRATFAARTLLALTLIAGISACTKVQPVAEADYASEIVGDWMGAVGDMKESISFSADDSFVAKLRPQGFISNTLSEGVTGTIRGTWEISGSTITMQITSSEDERLENSSTSSTILSFSKEELSLKSDRGEVSTFNRTTSL